MAERAGLDLAWINLQQPPVLVWRDILELAAQTGTLRKLVDCAAADLQRGSTLRPFLLDVLADRVDTKLWWEKLEIDKDDVTQPRPAKQAEHPRLLDGHALATASRTAREAVRPKHLPPIDRPEELRLILGSSDDYPMVILGEGGMGKSVLAGDLIDAAGRSSLLVPCTRVPSNANLDTVDAIDRALADAASDTRGAGPLSELLEGLAERPLLVIDTLDLILNEDTADNLHHLLRRLSRVADLVGTCRDREWEDYLGDHEPLQSLRLGLLTRDSILQWIDAYLASAKLDVETAQEFRHSVQRILRKDVTAVNLVGSPVRLGMVCALYAASGALPDGLSVAALYLEYWDQKVGRDRRGRRNTADATEQLALASNLAQRLWGASTDRFSEFTALPDDHHGALRRLNSAGILKQVGNELVGFFHQTFAEFAVARHLGLHAVDADWSRLNDALTLGSPAHWGIAAYLAATPMASTQLARAVGSIPLTPEGVRVVLRLISTCGDLHLLDAWIRRLESDQPTLLRQTFAALGGATAASAPIVVAAALRQMASAEPGLSSVVGTLPALLRQLSGTERSAGLVEACGAMAALGQVATTDIYRLLADTLGAAGGYDLAALLPLYPRIGAAAQGVIIRTARSQDPRLMAEVLAQSLSVPCPSAAMDDMVELMDDIWSSPAARGLLGWDTWREMLDQQHPARWVGAQVRLLRRLCRDGAVRRQLIEAVLTQSEPFDRKRYTDAAGFAATDDPHDVAALMIGVAHEPNRPRAGSLSAIMQNLGDRLPKPIVDALLAMAEAYLRFDPRRVLPAMVRVAAADSEQVDRIVGRLVAGRRVSDTPLEQRAIWSTWDALFRNLGSADLLRVRSDLELLVAGQDPEDGRRRDQLHGRLYLVDPRSRNRVLELIQDAGQPSRARVAVAEITPQIPDEPQEHLGAFVALVRSVHGSCVQAVAAALIPSAAHPGWTERDAGLVVQRLVESVLDPTEDAQVALALKDLLAQLAQPTQPAQFVSVAETRTILDAYRSAVGTELDEQRQPDLFGQMWSALNQIGAARLEPSEYVDRAVELASSIDAGAVSVSASAFWPVH